MDDIAPVSRDTARYYAQVRRQLQRGMHGESQGLLDSFFRKYDDVQQIIFTPGRRHRVIYLDGKGPPTLTLKEELEKIFAVFVSCWPWSNGDKITMIIFREDYETD